MSGEIPKDHSGVVPEPVDSSGLNVLGRKSGIIPFSPSITDLAVDTGAYVKIIAEGMEVERRSAEEQPKNASRKTGIVRRIITGRRYAPQGETISGIIRQRGTVFDDQENPYPCDAAYQSEQEGHQIRIIPHSFRVGVHPGEQLRNGDRMVFLDFNQGELESVGIGFGIDTPTTSGQTEVYIPETMPSLRSLAQYFLDGTELHEGSGDLTLTFGQEDGQEPWVGVDLESYRNAMPDRRDYFGFKSAEYNPSAEAFLPGGWDRSNPLDVDTCEAAIREVFTHVSSKLPK